MVEAKAASPTDPAAIDDRARSGSVLMAVGAVILPIALGVLVLSMAGSGYCSDNDSCESGASSWIGFSVLMLVAGLLLFFGGLRNRVIASRLREEARLAAAGVAPTDQSPGGSFVAPPTAAPVGAGEEPAVRRRSVDQASGRGARLAVVSDVLGLAGLFLAVWSFLAGDLGPFLYSLLGMIVGSLAAIAGGRALDTVAQHRVGRRRAVAGVVLGLTGLVLSVAHWLG